jgi:2-polyprenyl-6-methoxyphenol hydroxylase-like FAD-dependent oxidoreductase
MKALIIGGGIGGLAAAAAVRQAGHEVVVYEQAERFAEVGAGLARERLALQRDEQLLVDEAHRAVLAVQR